MNSEKEINMKMKSIKIILAGLLAVPMLSFGASMLAPMSALAADCNTDSLTIVEGAKCSKSDEQKSDLFGDGGIFTIVTNTALFVIGAISVLMLIYGGIRYTTSGGNEKSVTAAKNTILYAVVGIIVADMAYAIVNFVITQFVGGSVDSTTSDPATTE